MQTAVAAKKLATLFYEPSTRTRLSFTSAMMELGGNVIGFSDARNSSVSKGETVQDTVRVINCFADIIAMRHWIEGAPLAATQVSRTPVINAGDGSHSHPTQTLTDLLTIKRELGRLDNLTIGFCGDLKFGRTVHSLIKAMSRYDNIRIVLIAPPELRLPSYIKSEVCDRCGMDYREVDDMESVMPELDVLYMTRVQKERFVDEEGVRKSEGLLCAGCAKDVYGKERYGCVAPASASQRDFAGRLTTTRVPPISVRSRTVSSCVWLLMLRLLEWAEKDSLVERPAAEQSTGHTCSNPRCITNTEPVEPLFHASQTEPDVYRCVYCEARAK